MQHIAFASELAKAIVAERGAGASIRRLPRGEVRRVEARLEDDRRARAFDHRLSVAGAVGFLVLLVLGPAALGVAALGAVLAAVIAPAVIHRRPAGTSGDRWQLWRRVDPDPEYLRDRAA